MPPVPCPSGPRGYARLRIRSTKPPSAAWIAYNRPPPIYVPPDLSVDRSMLAGSIDPSLPYIKQQGVQALTGEYNQAQHELPLACRMTVALAL